MKKKIKKSIYVKIKLINSGIVSGYMNIAGYDRLSDLINDNKNRFLIVYSAVDCGIEDNILMICKDQIISIKINEAQPINKAWLNV